MSDESSIITCQNCGEPLEPNFEVCPNCGKPIARLCPQCQRVVKSKWKFCPKCQAPLSGWATPTQGQDSVKTKTSSNDISRTFLTEGPNSNEVPLSEGEELLGRFTIKNRLGVGGFGSVYQAHDREHGSDVALKVVVAGSGQTQAAAEQLRQELRLRDRINDFTHIIRTYDIHTVDYKGLSFVILPMEYAEEGSLRSWLNKNKHNREHRVSEGLELFRQACFGVKAIHNAGLVHLDLKPENVLLCKDGNKIIVKVSDFGISRNVEHFSKNVSSVTQASLGTPYYMSPEQIHTARQKDVGPKADIYSLGVILFEILDGDPPFDDSGVGIKSKHLEEEPPKLKNIKENITSVVYKCLAKKPSERAGNVDAVLDGLRENIPLATKADSPVSIKSEVNRNKLCKAFALLCGTAGEINFDKAIELLLDLAEQGDPFGKILIAGFYYKGDCGFPLNVRKAKKMAGEVIEQIKQLSNEGDEKAAYILGSAYEEGLFLGQNYKKAAECYRKAAEAGEICAMTELGLLYENGTGVTRDYKKAIEWYRKAAEAGDTSGMVQLGIMYQDGIGISKDYEKALELYLKAADAGYGLAVDKLDFMCSKGLGIPKNSRMARELYSRAAAAGSSEAMKKLELPYEEDTVSPSEPLDWQDFTGPRKSTKIVSIIAMILGGIGFAVIWLSGNIDADKLWWFAATLISIILSIGWIVAIEGFVKKIKLILATLFAVFLPGMIVVAIVGVILEKAAGLTEIMAARIIYSIYLGISIIIVERQVFIKQLKQKVLTRKTAIWASVFLGVIFIFISGYDNRRHIERTRGYLATKQLTQARMELSECGWFCASGKAKLWDTLYDAENGNRQIRASSNSGIRQSSETNATAWKSNRGTLSNGLIHYYSCEENTNKRGLVDIVSGKNSSLMWGTPKVNRKGIKNYGWAFNGNDAIAWNDTLLPDLTAGDDFTLSMWAYNTGLSNSNDGIWSTYYTKGSNAYFLLDIYDGKLRFIGANMGFTNNYQANLLSISSNRWYHYVLRKKGSSYTIFVNGRSIFDARGNSAVTWDKDKRRRFIVGSQNSASPGKYWWNGYFDEFGVWTRSLSDEEVSKLYNRGNGLSYNQIVGSD